MGLHLKFHGKNYINIKLTISTSHPTTWYSPSPGYKERPRQIRWCESATGVSHPRVSLSWKWKLLLFLWVLMQRYGIVKKGGFYHSNDYCKATISLRYRWFRIISRWFSIIIFLETFILSVTLRWVKIVWTEKK